MKLPHVAALAEKIKLAQPIKAWAERILPEKAAELGVGTAAGKMSGGALIPAAVRVFVLILPFWVRVIGNDALTEGVHHGVDLRSLCWRCGSARTQVISKRCAAGESACEQGGDLRHG